MGVDHAISYKVSGQPPKTMSPRRTAAQARFTRRTIVEAAAGLFADRRYVATSFDAVAEAAGVGRATVFSHFSTKAQLLKTAYDVTLVGDDEAIPLPERPESLAVRANPDPPGFLIGYTSIATGVARGSVRSTKRSAVQPTLIRRPRPSGIKSASSDGSAPATSWPEWSAAVPSGTAPIPSRQPTSCTPWSIRASTTSSSGSAVGHMRRSPHGWPRPSAESCSAPEPGGLVGRTRVAPTRPVVDAPSSPALH
ncbi:MAG: TetR/AcrR family transcriptional regulator [Chloroflexi bacterium]|nr:TetR/AcrR family transcriptional regulator [Chloroflexota bacterium]